MTGEVEIIDRGPDHPEIIHQQLRRGAIEAQQVYEDWSLKEYWTNDEAAALGIGVDPARLNAFPFLNRGDGKRFEKLHDLISRKFTDRVKPKEFVDWASEIGIELENGIVEAVNQRKKKKVGTRQQDIDNREQTADKIIIAMAVKKYGYMKGRVSLHDVAKQIAKDFDELDSGLTLADTTITTRLKAALEKQPSLAKKWSKDC